MLDVAHEKTFLAGFFGLAFAGCRIGSATIGGQLVAARFA
jgi:hypothetical protein